jgi:hypothetical protein
MLALFTHNSLLLGAAGHRGPMFWIVGWTIILAAVIGGAAWIVRARRRPGRERR